MRRGEISANVVDMSMLNNVTSVLFCIAATAVTYLVMQLVVAPRLLPSPVDVPTVNGLTPEQARGLTDPRGLLLVFDSERAPDSDKIAAGTLFDQHPLGGSRLHPGEKVHATMARAQQTVRVPPIVGQALDAAKQALTDQGLHVGSLTEEASASVAQGALIRTQPAPGSDVHPGDPVALVVSKGNEQVAVPNLRGRGVSSAKQLLEQAGLVLGEQRKGVDDNANDGVIIKQSPAAGTLVPKGQKIDLVVNE